MPIKIFYTSMLLSAVFSGFILMVALIDDDRLSVIQKLLIPLAGISFLVFLISAIVLIWTA